MSTLFVVGVLVFEVSMLWWMWMMFHEQKRIRELIKIILKRSGKED